MGKSQNSNLANKLFPIVAVAMCVFHLYTVVQPSLDSIQQQAIHLCFALVLVFLDCMSVKDGKKPKTLNVIVDIVLMAVSIYSLT